MYIIYGHVEHAQAVGELDLCNFPDFLIQLVREVSVPLTTLLCELRILTPIKVLSPGQQMVPMCAQRGNKWPWQQSHNGRPGV